MNVKSISHKNKSDERIVESKKIFKVCIVLTLTISNVVLRINDSENFSTWALFYYYFIYL